MPDEHDSEHQQKLKTTLDELHAELGQVEELDPAVRRELEVAADEILGVLAKPQRTAKETEHAESFVAQLRQATERFEDTHPTLSGIVGSVIDALGRMGI